MPHQQSTKKRGRPATGKAMTAAQRKRFQRERAKEAIWGAGDNLTDVPTSALIEELGKCVSRGHDAILAEITRELVKRAKASKAKK